ncbi:MAG: PIN domain-containing protein [Firmicutes bacterium]|nr:PIN domain-containing protein [Bacillota bacterium]MCL5039889.1 PIN domain-containing protein [Bacillota bacterium]
MSSYLLDSDAIINYLAGRKDTVRLINQLSEVALPGCSALTVIEVKVGLRPKDAHLADELFSVMRIYPVDLAVAEKAWQLMTEWKRKGFVLHLVDASIAATCIVNGLPLLSYNRKHYPMGELILIDT